MSSATVHTDARAALRTRLKTLPSLPARRAWEGFSFDPVRGQPFIEDKLVADYSEPRAIGAIQHRMSYILTLKFPANAGTADIEALGGALLDHFKVGTKLASGAGSLLCYKAERRGSIVTEADWVVLTVVVTVEAFTTE